MQQAAAQSGHGAQLAGRVGTKAFVEATNDLATSIARTIQDRAALLTKLEQIPAEQYHVLLMIDEYNLNLPTGQKYYIKDMKHLLKALSELFFPGAKAQTTAIAGNPFKLDATTSKWEAHVGDSSNFPSLAVVLDALSSVQTKACFSRTQVLHTPTAGTVQQPPMYAQMMQGFQMTPQVWQQQQMQQQQQMMMMMMQYQMQQMQQLPMSCQPPGITATSGSGAASALAPPGM